ncbi:MAG: L-seryl-tRNA(Sec) selenium transferase [Gammaproteobacteria bacterium]
MTATHVNVPSIDRLLRDPLAVRLVAAHGHAPVVAALREAAAILRAQQLAGSAVTDPAATLLTTAEATLAQASAASLRPVFNLTGTVLHTNLGRAPLPPAAIEAIAAVAGGATNLEFDLASGRRGDRDVHVEPRLIALTGAEAATVVNNNAAAVMLVLNALARGREVLVSRGELVEIGGSFRVPDVMKAAGVKLREVGTTNRVHLRDFAEALGPRTALVMKIHPSNYRIEGFTASVAEAELAALARAHGVPFVVDLGSGTLLDFARCGLPPEPTVQGTLAAGADLVTFSGDKLLGGPQAGLIVGRRDLVTRVKKNPMTRALRVDKLILAALDAVLRLSGDLERARAHLPALRLLTRPQAEIEILARALQPQLTEILEDIADVDVVPCASQIGSGALPVETLPSAGLALRPRAGQGGAQALAARLRALPQPVIGRVHQGAVILDLRCLETPDAFVAGFTALRTAPPAR